MFHIFDIVEADVSIGGIGKDARPGETRFGPEITTPDGDIVHRVGLLIVEEVGGEVHATLVASSELTFEERRSLIAFLEAEANRENTELVGRFDVWTHTMRVREG